MAAGKPKGLSIYRKLIAILNIKKHLVYESRN